MERILLTGASGMLGKQLLNQLNAQNRYKVFTVGRIPLKASGSHFVNDITDSGQLTSVLKACEPEIIINCAAYVNVDYCENNHLQTDLLHQHAVSGFSSYSSVQSVYYISTDSVFDGLHGNYLESSITNPLNYYAVSKLNGENEVLKKSKKAYIIRTNILGFDSALGKSLFEWCYQNLSSGNRINGFSNVYFNPLYVGDLAKMLITFMGMNCNPGIYNFASQPPVSKYTALLKIASAFGFDENLVEPVNLDTSKINAIRPLNTTLNTDKISNLGIKIPDINTSIKNLHNDFFKHGIRI